MEHNVNPREESKRRALVTAQLQNDPGAAELKKMALADIVLRAITALGSGEFGIAALRARIAELAGVTAVPEESVVAALTLLSQRGAVRAHGGNWSLTDEGSERIKNEAEATKRRIDSILLRHFPGSADRVTLEKWFRAAMSVFFQRYSDRWVQQVCRKSARIVPAQEIIDAAVEEANKLTGLKDERGALRRGLLEFISSENHEDNAQLWTFGQTAFAARLVAADIGHDPITINAFRDSTLLLDTNILIAACLEGHRFSSSLSALCKALGKIGVKLGYTYATKQEYTAAVERQRDLVSKAFAYPVEVLRRAEGDAFLQTALARGCTTAADALRMFSTIASPPRQIGDGMSIEEISGIEVDNAANKAARDKKRKSDIADAWARIHPRPKSEYLAEHDAALNGVAEFLQAAGRPTFILTLDRSMTDLSLKWAGQHQLPIWISLDVLVQVLAVHGAGPEYDPTDFGPLLARMIMGEIQVSGPSFTVDDLDWLLDIDARTASLPTDVVEDFAGRLARARVEGTTKGDTAVRLEIQRSFQKWKREMEDRVGGADRVANEAKAALEREEKRIAAQRRVLFDDYKRGCNRLLSIAYGTAGIVLAGVTLYFIYDAVAAAIKTGGISAGKITVAFLTACATILVYWQLLVPAWCGRGAAAERYAARKIEDIERRTLV